MKYLLDTQVALWVLWGDKRLGPSTSKLLTDMSQDLAVSYFSLLELAIKAGVGKFDYDDSVFDYLDKLDISVLAPDRDCLSRYKVHNHLNKDPFDNMLLTVALGQKRVFVTGDGEILSTEVRGLRTLDARK